MTERQGGLGSGAHHVRRGIVGLGDKREPQRSLLCPRSRLLLRAQRRLRTQHAQPGGATFPLPLHRSHLSVKQAPGGHRQRRAALHQPVAAHALHRRTHGRTGRSAPGNQLHGSRPVREHACSMRVVNHASAPLCCARKHALCRCVCPPTSPQQAREHASSAPALCANAHVCFCRMACGLSLPGSGSTMSPDSVRCSETTAAPHASTAADMSPNVRSCTRFTRQAAGPGASRAAAHFFLAQQLPNDEPGRYTAARWCCPCLPRVHKLRPAHLRTARAAYHHNAALHSSLALARAHVRHQARCCSHHAVQLGRRRHAQRPREQCSHKRAPWRSHRWRECARSTACACAQTGARMSGGAVP